MTHFRNWISLLWAVLILTTKPLYLKQHNLMFLEWPILLTLCILFLQWYNTDMISPLKQHSIGNEKQWVHMIMGFDSQNAMKNVQVCPASIQMLKAKLSKSRIIDAFWVTLERRAKDRLWETKHPTSKFSINTCYYRLKVR